MQQTGEIGETGGSVEFDYTVVADLQDHLLAASTDLERLIGLLADAAAQLMASFSAAHAHVGAGLESPQASAAIEKTLGALRSELAGAITALQFSDMATQLVDHSVRRIRSVADFLGSQVMAEDGAAPVTFVQRPCPVAQREMDAGSVELF